jgi:hypothetical protein
VPLLGLRLLLQVREATPAGLEVMVVVMSAARRRDWRAGLGGREMSFSLEEGGGMAAMHSAFIPDHCQLHKAVLR